MTHLCDLAEYTCLTPAASWVTSKVHSAESESQDVSGRRPVMGHHNNITVESATNSEHAPLPSTSASQNSIGRNGKTSGNGKNCNGSAGSRNCTGTESTSAAVAMQYSTTVPDRSSSDYYYYYAYDNATESTALFFPLNSTGAGGRDAPYEKPVCQWIPAQQSLFQFSNICFLTAFIVPRSYKLSVLSLR